MDLLSECKASEVFEGQVVVYKHLYAYIYSMCLKWCLELNIPDIIHNHGQPISLHDLVSTLQVPPSKIGGVPRLMRYLAHHGFFRAHDSQIVKLALKDHSDVFEGLESIVDVGGGNGTISKIINELFPQLKCIVFDLPHVVENLLGNNNLSFVGGDMFHSIPQADALLLKWILHDWNDENCVKILKQCKDAISKNSNGGKIIIIDCVINEKCDEYGHTQMKLMMDILYYDKFEWEGEKRRRIEETIFGSWVSRL
ncbi:hypothetical protein PIB30_023119 [Stylosanthes scabra]|uniref:Uncharacterized protein n=1 Tax=Stylosanthes scabra TaxID=79078 RepID=A0ABU6Q9M1_9FABA|nr:hypothetical protein [Stylosanthes scabra]